MLVYRNEVDSISLEDFLQYQTDALTDEIVSDIGVQRCY